MLSKLIKIVEDYKKKDVKNDKRMHLNQKDNNNHFCCIIPGNAFAAFSVLNSAALRAQIVMLQNEEGYYFEKSENRVISSLLYLF